jgi:hypothetical protein
MKIYGNALLNFDHDFHWNFKRMLAFFGSPETF